MNYKNRAKLISYYGKPALAETYRDFINNYLTVEKFAEHRDMQINYARLVLELGRECHELECVE